MQDGAVLTQPGMAWWGTVRRGEASAAILTVQDQVQVQMLVVRLAGMAMRSLAVCLV